MKQSMCRNQEETAILSIYQDMCNAMVTGNIRKLKTYLGDTVTHMSGYEQNTEDWLEDIEAGNMKYYNIDIEQPRVKIQGINAQLNCISVLDASVYGIHGRWEIPEQAQFIKKEGSWYMIPGSNHIRR